MGLDLKAYLEYRSGKQYELFAAIRIPRNYELFAILLSDKNMVPSTKFLPAELAFHTLVCEEDWLIEINDEKFALYGGDFYCRQQDVDQLIIEKNFQRLDANHLGADILHSNWLMQKKLEELYAMFLNAHSQPVAEVQAVIEAMKQLPNARLVLWLTT